jgi:hypothetical protein
MKNTIRFFSLTFLTFFILSLGQGAFAQALDDQEIISQTQDALRHSGITVGKSNIRIQESNGKRHIVINISGRRTLIVDMVYNTFYTVGSITQKAKDALDVIVVQASAQYKEMETYYFSAPATCTENLYNSTISPDEFINNCMTIK